MERQDNGMNGHITNDDEIVVARNESQASRFRRDWKENVLSLDGGGIRGYATLRMLEKMMDEVRVQEKECDQELRAAHSITGYKRERDPLTTRSPLPCHYFDYIVGTSTGGLIAIMLGRLRMPVTQCLAEYEDLGNKVFGQRRLFHYYRYSHKELEKLVKDVVRRNCLDPDSGVRGDAKMYQNDADGTACRTVVLAIEKRKKQDDELHAFKSYFDFPNAEQALGKALNPSNPKRVYIRQAARATSAAPGFFREADVNGNVYMDGALMHNNPSLWAWNEAWRKYPERSWQAPNGQNNNQNNNNHHNTNNNNSDGGNSITQTPSDPSQPQPHPHPHPQRIGVFLSLGTGLKAPRSAFHRGDPVRSVRALLRKAVGNMTDCESVHRNMLDQVQQHGCAPSYHRFNPPGLECVRLDECRRGDRTFRAMDAACAVYLAEVADDIRACAAELVRLRRSRCAGADLLRFHDLTRPGPLAL